MKLISFRFAVTGLVLLFAFAGCSSKNRDRSATSSGDSAYDSADAMQSTAKVEGYKEALRAVNKGITDVADRMSEIVVAISKSTDPLPLFEEFDLKLVQWLKLIEVKEDLYSEQFLKDYFKEEFAAEPSAAYKFLVSVAEEREKLRANRESLLNVRVNISAFRTALQPNKEIPVASRPESAKADVKPTTEDPKPAVSSASTAPKPITSKEADVELSKKRASAAKATPLERKVLETDMKRIAGRLEAGSLITYGSDGLPVVLTPSTEASYLSRYSSGAVETLGAWARKTDGLIGLSGPTYLPKVIDVIFEHIKTNVGLGSPVEIAFVLDDTGSMQPYIDAVKNNLTDLVNSLEAWKRETGINIRLSLVIYRDKGDSHVVKRVTDLTPTFSEMRTSIATVHADGGGDSPEAALDAIDYTLNNLSWTPGSSRRMILISDAPAHPTTIDGTRNADDIANSCRSAGTPVVIYPVVTSGY